MAEEQAPSRRPDHFAHMRPSIPTPPPEADQPIVRPDLLEALEQAFVMPALGVAWTADQAVESSHRLAQYVGQQEVIAFIRNLVRGA